MIKKPKNLTKRPGVYLFKNTTKDIIYIGKAKNIATRISSYFFKDSNYKTTILLQEATHIDTIPTQSETEALYLEAQLIKQYQPKFNILLKDGNPFTFILFSQTTTPQISLPRNKDKKGTYFGPFLTKKHAQSVYKFLVTTFQLKLCNKNIEHGCLEYHIGICAGICTKSFDKEFYNLKLNLAKNVLKKQSKKATTMINKAIQISSQELKFERAKHLIEYKQNFETIIHTLQKLSKMPSKQTTCQQKNFLPVLIDIKKKLKLKHIPYVIDCFDISHMQGKAIVGSCIRYVHGQPEKKSFRHFKVNSLRDQNDYAALQEIVQRRYKNKSNYPNLIIVDGGKGQINAIKPYISDTELVGLAKSEETIISADFKFYHKLNVQKPEDALLLQIRDYAHHFAISYHKKKHSILAL